MHSQDLVSIPVATGILQPGATVRSTRTPDKQGLVSRIYHGNYGPCVEIEGRYSDLASQFELLAPPAAEGLAMSNQSKQGICSGELEVRVAHEQDRIYFADTPAQVIALLELKIGIAQPVQAVEELARVVRAGRFEERRYRGSFGAGVGPLAYVSTGAPERPRPRFAIGSKVSFYSGRACTVSGIQLLLDGRPTPGATSWYYEYAEAPRPNASPMCEHDTQAAQIPRRFSPSRKATPSATV